MSTGEAADSGPEEAALDVAGLRGEIAAVDQALVAMVARRLDLARRLGALKEADRAATLDPRREAEVIRHAVEAGRQAGLPSEPVRQLFWTLIELCRSAQMEERT